jgi:hypothetical protein
MIEPPIAFLPSLCLLTPELSRPEHAGSRCRPEIDGSGTSPRPRAQLPRGPAAPIDVSQQILVLYSRLGFDAREPVSVMQGPPLRKRVKGCSVRQARASDVEDCNRQCMKVHGHDRAGELTDAIKNGTAVVVERHERITGYATALAFFGHAVAETNLDLQALISSAEAFAETRHHRADAQFRPFPLVPREWPSSSTANDADELGVCTTSRPGHICLLYSSENALTVLGESLTGKSHKPKRS